MTYPTYPSYPPNSYYNPWRSYEQAAANVEPAPAPQGAHGMWMGRYSLVFAVVTVAVTLAAVCLAILGPALAQHLTTGPGGSGLTQVFDTRLTDGTDWDNTNGCAFSPAGLDVSSSAGYTLCQYQPSVSNDLTSEGFWFQVTVAPAASIQGQETAAISAGGANVVLTQQGSFTVCEASQQLCGVGATTASGSTDAWHTDAYVANTIAIRYIKDTSSLTVYVNGQQIAALPASAISGPVVLGTTPGAEALYTHAVLYSGAGS